MTAPSGEFLVTTTRQLQDLVEHIRAAGRFAFDTEFVSEDTFEPVLCLVQVATRERLALIDPLAVRDLDPFWDVVCDPVIDVVMHAAGEDLRICHIKTGRLAAAGLRRADGGRAGGIQLSAVAGQPGRIRCFERFGGGGETRTDWRRRPLSAAQVEYALDDVRYPARARRSLHREPGRARAQRPGRMRSSRNSWRRSRSRADEERWRRLPGLNHARPPRDGDGTPAFAMARGRGAAAESAAAAGHAR